MTDADAHAEYPADLLAAEFALGVLTLEDHRAAEARALSDPAFDAAALAWSERLSPLLDEIASVTPSPGLWAKIEARLGLAPSPGVAGVSSRRRITGRGDIERLTRSRSIWRAAALGALAAAFACIVVLSATVFRPAPPRPSLMLARLTAQTGGAPIVAVYDPERRTVLVSLPGGLPPSGRAAELWLIGPSGKPRALGVVEDREAFALTLSPALVDRMMPNAVLAVSIEPHGGSPTGLPTGSVIAKGVLRGA